MSIERPNVSSAATASKLKPLESTPEAIITLHVRLSDKVDRLMEIKVPYPIFERIAKRFEERGVKPKFVTAGVVVFVVAATAGIVAKKATEEFKKIQQQKIDTPPLGNEQKEEFGKLYQASYSQIHSFIRSRLWGVPAEDIDDLTQKIFENAWRHFPPKTTLPNFSNPYLPWLYAIARNAVINRYRDSLTEKKRTAEPVDDEFLTRIGTPDTTSIVEEQEEGVELQNAISSLRDPYPLIIWLKVSLQWSNKEIASLTGRTVSAVKSTYYRATEELKKIYSKKLDF